MLKKYKLTKYRVNGKEVDILEEDWNILIILDACRYDIFKEVYKEFFVNGLEKAISPATYTMEFLNKIFIDYYEDIIYVSANPFINSRGKVTHRCKNGFYNVIRSFDATKHFFKIVDVWHHGWDSNLNTVHPLEVNRSFHKIYLRYPDKRFILHYIQPHTPYITIAKRKGENINDNDVISSRNTSFIRNVANKFFSQGMNWKIKKVLALPTYSEIEKIYRRNGWRGIKEVYKNEVRLVLKYVKMLVDVISTNFLITADHGERLGEKWWQDGHGPGRRDREVVEVPWLEIKKRKE